MSFVVEIIKVYVFVKIVVENVILTISFKKNTEPFKFMNKFGDVSEANRKQ